MSGRVTDEDGRGLEAVSVVYGDSAVYTAQTGNYVYENLPDGIQGIRFILDGYYDEMRLVNIPDGGTASCDVTMGIYTSGWAAGAEDSGYGTVLHTSDAGRTWVRQGGTQTIPDTHLRDVCAVSDSVCWIVGDVDAFRNRTVILRTDDAGNTWANQITSGSLPAMDLAAIVSRDGVNAWAVAADTCVVLRTDDGGSSWEICRTSPDVMGYSSVTTSDGVNIWCCGTGVQGGAVVEYSADGGSSWTVFQVAASYPGQVPEDICVSVSGVLYMTGSGAMGVLSSRDGGLSWTSVTEAAGDQMSLDICGDENIWFCGDGGMLYYTSDAFFTRNETAPASGIYPGGRAVSVAFLRDGLRGVISVQSESGETGTVMYTSDGGSVWTVSSVPFSFSIESLDFPGGNN